MNKCSKSYVIRVLQIITMRYLSEGPKSGTPTPAHVGEDVEQQDPVLGMQMVRQL